MKNVYLVIDMQNDFLTGVLGAKECESVITPICNTLKEKVTRDDVVIFTKDTHEKETYPDTLEGKNIPAHCIKGTEGWDYPSKIREALDCCKKVATTIEIEKPSFGSLDVLSYLYDNAPEIENIYLMGVCTSICVHAQAVLARTACPNSNIYLLSSCCGDGNKTLSDATLTSLKALEITVLEKIQA